MKIDQKLREEFATQDLSPLLPIICRYHGNTFSDTIEKYVLHIYTPRQTSIPSFMEIWQKLRKCLQHKIFHHFGSYYVNCYHGNKLFVNVEKCVILTYILRKTFNMNFMRIGQTLMKQFCHEAFCPRFCQ